MKKKIYFFASIITIVTTIMTFKPDVRNSTHLKLNFVPKSIEALQDNSEIILLGTFTKGVSIIEEDALKFYISEVKVDELIQGNLDTELIQLLQTYSYEDPIISDNNQILLFLEKYTGILSENDNTYVCKGLGYGQYNIKRDIVSPALINNKILSNLSSENRTKMSLNGDGISVSQLTNFIKGRLTD